MPRILNLTVEDLPHVGPLLQTPREQIGQWTEAISLLTQIALEALELFTEANRRIETALAQDAASTEALEGAKYGTLVPNFNSSSS